ncbi:hypothetical protein H0H93_013978, partial [Arthromyces matolae]
MTVRFPVLKNGVGSWTEPNFGNTTTTEWSNDHSFVGSIIPEEIQWSLGKGQDEDPDAGGCYVAVSSGESDIPDSDVEIDWSYIRRCRRNTHQPRIWDPVEMAREYSVIHEPMFSVPKMTFDEYTHPVDHGEVRVCMLEEEEGCRPQLDFAPARMLEFFLEVCQPYPGDPVNALQFKGPRFVVYQVSETDLVIMDGIFPNDDLIPISQVCTPGFEPGLWYAQLCSARYGLPVTQMSRYGTSLACDVWSWNAKRVLESAVRFGPDLGARKHISGRFDVDNIENSPDYRVNDSLLRFRTTISGSRLQNPKFNLVRWMGRQYDRQVRRRTRIDVLSDLGHCLSQWELASETEESFG